MERQSVFTVWPVTALIGILTLLVSQSVCAEPPKGYPFVRYDKGLQTAQEKGKKIFLYFGRYGCGFCDKTNKESFSNPDIKKRYINHYILVYVDAESGRRLHLPSGEQITEQQLGARLKTLVTPYFLFLEPDGTLIMKAPGFKTVEDLQTFDRYINEGHYKTMSLAQFVESKK
jgi:thioredoxin-related protein